MKNTLEQNIIEQLNNFRSSMSFVFVGGLIFGQGIHAVSALLVKGYIEYYGFTILIIGILMILFGVVIFSRAKKKVMIAITA